MGDNNKKKFYQKEWFKYLSIMVVSIAISIIGIKNNIDYERNRIFKEMRGKVKSEVEKSLYKEMFQKYKDSVREDLRKEYKEFVKVELESTLKEDTLRTLKHEIEFKGTELLYEVFENMEYKVNNEKIRSVKVIVNNLEDVFEEELEGLFYQIFGNDSKNKGVLLVFDKDPEECDFIAKYKIESGLDNQLITTKDGNDRNC